jgi:hypothetical protein
MGRFNLSFLSSISKATLFLVFFILASINMLSKLLHPEVLSLRQCNYDYTHPYYKHSIPSPKVCDGRRFIGVHREVIRGRAGKYKRHLQILNRQELKCARLVACAASSFTSGKQRKEDSFYKFELSQGKFSRTSFPSMFHREATAIINTKLQSDPSTAS